MNKTKIANLFVYYAPMQDLRYLAGLEFGNESIVETSLDHHQQNAGLIQSDGGAIIYVGY